MSILKPLVMETINKAFDNVPSSVQTGPAARGDKETMGAHLNQLNDEQLKTIYKNISDHIRSLNESNNG